MKRQAETQAAPEVHEAMDESSRANLKRQAEDQGSQGIEEAMNADMLEEIENLVKELGFFGVHVSELFGPGKFTGRAGSFGLNPGHAFDLCLKDENGVQWDLSDPDRQALCEKIIDYEKPYILIGSPMCRAFSA